MKIPIKAYAYKILKTPPHKLVRIIASRLSSNLKNRWSKIRTITFPYKPVKTFPAIQYSYLKLEQLTTEQISAEVAAFLSDMYIQHRFDLLGSGWIQVDYNIDEPGLGGYKYGMSPRITDFDSDGEWLNQILLPVHLSYSSWVWKQIGKDYTPIDWQMDYKSGYRWDNKKWFMDQRIGVKPGVDIKVPWELARMQHLPQMAVFAKILPDRKDQLIQEFRNQVLDFICTNPVRMGVNWRCTMDVAIRCVNIIVAYDLFQQMDERQMLDESFKEILSRSLYEHGLFITEHFEWSDVLTSNHYLSNVCGLLFISAYLARTSETDEWLAFAVQEVIQETEKQFHPDGSNFEASTSYHRLSGEMVLYSAALIYGIRDVKGDALHGYQVKLLKRLKRHQDDLYDLGDEDLFKESFLSKLYRSGLFAADITKPNGEIVQIGDNDSGRFLRWSPNGVLLTKEQAESMYANLKGYSRISTPELYWDENSLNLATYISGISGLFPNDDFEDYRSAFPLEASIVSSLSNEKKLNVGRWNDENRPLHLRANLLENPQPYTTTTKIPIDSDYLECLKFKSYPDFGLYIYKSDTFFLSLMAGHNGQNGNAGHTHNDKLSIVLYANGNDIYTDPGSYVYTPLPDERNRFRSVLSHNTIVIDGQEQNESLTLFAMKNESKCEVLQLNDREIIAEVKYREVCHRRVIVMLDREIRIVDHCNFPFQVHFNDGVEFSNGYGKMICNRSTPIGR